MNRPLAIDLCCGLGGWTAGLLAEGWRVIGFDIARPRSFPPGAVFVQQDIATIDGARWKGLVQLIVASPPCTEFTQVWRYSKWRRPDPEKGMEIVRHCFRIAREAGCPFIVENVLGAREFFAPEFGRPTWHVGPFWFWGDAPVLRPQGRFIKGIWNTERDKLGNYRYPRNGKAAYLRDPARRALIPLEIARAVGAQLRP